MRRSAMIVVLLLIAPLFLFTACDKEETGENGTNFETPNPVVSYDSEAGFATLGLTMETPKGAENIEYSAIDETVAQITFDLNNCSYTFRGSATDKDFSGIYEEFEEDTTSFKVTPYLGSNSYTNIEIKTTKSQGKLATWEWPTASYTLYTPNCTDENAMHDVSSELAINTCQTE